MLEANPSCELLFGFTAAELQGVHLGMLLGAATATVPEPGPRRTRRSTRGHCWVSRANSRRGIAVARRCTCS